MAPVFYTVLIQQGFLLPFQKESADDFPEKKQKIPSGLFQLNFGSVAAQSLASDIGSDRKNDWKSVDKLEKTTKNHKKPSDFRRNRDNLSTYHLNTCQSANYNLLKTKDLRFQRNFPPPFQLLTAVSTVSRIRPGGLTFGWKRGARDPVFQLINSKSHDIIIKRKFLGEPFSKDKKREYIYINGKVKLVDESVIWNIVWFERGRRGIPCSDCLL